MADSILSQGHMKKAGTAALDAAECQRTREELAGSEARFRALVENSSDLVAVINSAGIFEFQSPSSEPILGYRPEEFIGRNAFAFIHPDDLERTQHSLTLLAQGHRKPFESTELRFRHKDGSWRVLDAKARRLPGSGNAAYVLNSRDITDSKKDAEALRESERMLTALLANLPGMAYRCANDSDWTELFVSGGCVELTGYQVADLEGSTLIAFNDLVHPDDRQRVWEETQRSLVEKRPYRFPYRIETATGEIKWVWDQGSGVYDAAGDLLFLEGFIMDISEKVCAEESLRESEERFGALVEAAPMGIFVQTKGKFAYANRAANELFGAGPGDSLTGESIVERFQPDDRDGVWEMIRLLNEERREVPINEETILNSRGERVDVEVTAVPFTFGGDDGALVFLSDITERKHALQEATKLNRILNDSLNEIYLFDAETLKFVQANHGARQNIGYTMDELRDMTPIDIKPFMDRRTFAEILDSLRSGREQAVVFFTEHQRKDRSFYPVEVHLQLAESEREPVFVAIILDITERQRSAEALAKSEEQLRQSQKMEAIGQLAGGIAHDFNNLLTAILGYSEMILSDGEAQGLLVQDYTKEIKRGAERAAALTLQILAFSRRQALQPVPVSPNVVLAGMEPLLCRTLGENIDLVTRLHPDPGLTEVDVHQFEQVLMNLAVNARDAMPLGGQLTLETANVELDHDYCRIHPDVMPGSYVLFSVSDTGAGMDRETQLHIFEPFFTTKAPGAGTGLGLSTVYGIVKQSGGSITVYSEPGQGSTFKVYLPRMAEPESVVPPLVSAPSSKQGQETILVVEDEESLRGLVARILGGLGYTVLIAATAGGALELLANRNDPVDLLLTDVVLPGGIQGNDLAQILVSSQPDLPVLYMSGYTRNAIVHSGRLDEGVNYLEKPFTPDSLATKVREVLDVSGVRGRRGRTGLLSC